MNPINHRGRRAVGVLARKHCPRKALAHLRLQHCPGDPLAILARSMQGRVPDLIPIKYQRMAASPFGFFRGAAAIMAADLAAHPHTGIVTQLCGDAHVANLGAFAAQDGSLVFDLNDFDETARGPFEWDVKRFCTSLLLSGREAGLKGEVRRTAVALFAESYRTAIQQFAAMPVVELARFQIRRLAHLPPVPAIFRMAQRSTPQRLLNKLTCVTRPSGRGRRFLAEPPLQQHLPLRERQQVLASLAEYSRTLQPERAHFFAQYRPVDVALRVVGTGSVGLRCYVIFLQGPSRRPDSDPLFIQIKQEAESVYAPYLPEPPNAVRHQGERVRDGQRMMQLVSDPFLGYTTVDGRDYLVRQFNDHKANLDLADLDAPTLHGYATLCGEVLARGHARGGDPAAIAGYIGSGDRFAKSILRFSLQYAQKTRHDWNALRKAIRHRALPEPAPARSLR